MNFRRLLALSAVAVACSAANAALAGPAGAAPVASAKPGTVRVSSVTVPPSVSERTRATLRDAVEQRLSEVVPEAPRGSYSVTVALLQLRR
jgi:hypothetical protein